MFNSVQFVRELCQKHRIPVAKLEKDCGFSNGYLNPKKMQKLPYDRACVIADYLGVSLDYILTGKEKSTPTVSGKRAINNDIKLSPEELELIQMYRRLDARGKSAVRNALSHEYAALPGDKAAPAPKQA